MTDATVRCTAITAVVVALCLGGCATRALPREVSWRADATSAAVTISNMSTLPARISLRRASVDVVLGTVLGLSSRTFEIDDRLLTDASELRLEARDRAGVVLRSDTFAFGTRRAALWQVGYRSTRVDVR